jgi:hypothetical protein
LFPKGTERVGGGRAQRHHRNPVQKTAYPAEGWQRTCSPGGLWHALPGCRPEEGGPPAVSLRSTVGYFLGCLRHHAAGDRHQSPPPSRAPLKEDPSSLSAIGLRLIFRATLAASLWANGPTHHSPGRRPGWAHKNRGEPCKGVPILVLRSRNILRVNGPFAHETPATPLSHPLLQVPESGTGFQPVTCHSQDGCATLRHRVHPSGGPVGAFNAHPGPPSDHSPASPPPAKDADPLSGPTNALETG